MLSCKVIQSINYILVRLGRSNDAHATFNEAYNAAKEMNDKQNQTLLLAEMEKIEDLEEFMGGKVCEGLKKESVVVVRASSAARANSAARKLKVKKVYRPDSGAQELKEQSRSNRGPRVLKA